MDAPGDTDIYWVECSSCGRWELYENYNTGKPYNPSKLSKTRLICRLCTLQQALQKATDDITYLQERIRALESDFVNDIKARSDNKSLASFNPVATDPSSYLRLTADEVFEISKRKLNVVISGLPEAGNDIEHFLNFVNTYHNLPTPITSDDIVHAERLGRSSTLQRPRLLCLQIHSLQIRRQLLEMWKSPKDGCGSRPNIYVRPDLTKTQLQTDKLLRQQLLIAGKDRFMIRRAQIVERNPSSTSATISSSAIQKLNLASTRLSTSGLRQTAAPRASNSMTQNSSAKPTVSLSAIPVLNSAGTTQIITSSSVATAGYDLQAGADSVATQASIASSSGMALGSALPITPISALTSTYLGNAGDDMAAQLTSTSSADVDIAVPLITATGSQFTVPQPNIRSGAVVSQPAGQALISTEDGSIDEAAASNPLLITTAPALMDFPPMSVNLAKNITSQATSGSTNAVQVSVSATSSNQATVYSTLAASVYSTDVASAFSDDTVLPVTNTVFTTGPPTKAATAARYATPHTTSNIKNLRASTVPLKSASTNTTFTTDIPTPGSSAPKQSTSYLRRSSRQSQTIGHQASDKSHKVSSTKTAIDRHTGKQSA